MSAFSYKAFDSKGKMVKGVIEGDSERQVRSQLRLQQLKPVAVTESAEKIIKPRAGFNFSGLFKSRISHSDLCLITRQMATLVQSGMPLDEVLTATAQQARKPRIKSLMLQVRARVLEGHSLAYALGDFPQIFNEMYCSMVKAGEAAGFLGTVLEQLADYTEESQHTAQKLKGAMIYPIILTLLSVAVIAVLMIFVVPDLVSMFNHTNQQLPALTIIVIATSEFFSEKWWLLIVGFIMVIVAWQQFLKSPQRRMAWHRLVLKLPLLLFCLPFVSTICTRAPVLVAKVLWGLGSGARN